MDIIVTIAVIYFGYRGYQWYQSVQDQVKAGGQAPPKVEYDQDFHDPKQPQPGDDDDYIEYEELKDDPVP